MELYSRYWDCSGNDDDDDDGDDEENRRCWMRELIVEVYSMTYI